MSAHNVIPMRGRSDVPHAIEAEKSILGSLALDGIVALEQCQRLRADMFYTDAHRQIFGAYVEMIEEGLEPSFQALIARRGNSWIDSVGGMGYIAELTEFIPRSLRLSGHVGIVIEKWKLRMGMRICERYTAQFAQEGPSDATLSLMQAEVFDVMQERATAKDSRIAALTVPALEATLDYKSSAMGMSYGHDRLDDFTFGMQDGEVTVVGARSGVGKSSLMIQAAYRVAKQGIPVDLYSLEMAETVVQQRLWALDSGLPFTAIRRKLLNLSEQRALRESAYRVAELPIRIYDDGDMTLNQIASMARLNARRNGMKLFAVDYAQRVNASGKDDTERVKETSRTLTNLAKSEGIHLMLLSQLRKMPVEQYNRPPHVSDLAETAQMERDAHTIVLLHRGYDEESASIAMNGELIIPKQRNGGTGAMQTQFNPKSLIFE